jgi:hypothetical protein
MGNIPEFSIDIDNSVYMAQLAKVTRYNFEREDHGIFTDNIMFEGSGWGQGLGGYTLDEYNEKTKKREGTAFGMNFILACYNILGSIGTTGQQVIVFRKDSWGNILGFAKVEPNGEFGTPFFPKKLLPTPTTTIKE